MKSLLKQYKVLIAVAIIALGMSSCYVEYPYGPYGRPHRHHYYYRGY